MNLKQLYKTYSLDELVEKYKKTRDELVFSVLYSKIMTLFYKYFASKFNSKEDAEDFILFFNQNLIKLIDMYEPKKSSFAYYIIQSMNCDFINYLQYKNRIKRKPIFIMSIDDCAKELKYEQEEISDKIIDIRIALEKLTDMQKRCIYLRYYEGYTDKEIAKIFQVSHSYIRNYMTEIRRKIKKIVEDEQFNYWRNTNT